MLKPTRVFRRVMEFQTLKDAVCLGRGESFVQGAGRVGRKVVHHHADPLRVRVMDIARSRMQSAKSRAVRWTGVADTLALREQARDPIVMKPYSGVTLVKIVRELILGTAASA
jgi:hypothetical protein